MTTKDKTIKPKKSISKDLPSAKSRNQNFNVVKALAHRELIVNTMASYCAELSQTLLVDYAENIALELVELPMTYQLNETLLSYQKSIIKNGLAHAGAEIILDMRRLVSA